MSSNMRPHPPFDLTVTVSTIQSTDRCTFAASCRFWRRGIDSTFLAKHCDGTWRSPVAHLNGVQGAAGSNPAVPMGVSGYILVSFEGVINGIDVGDLTGLDPEVVPHERVK